MKRKKSEILKELREELEGECGSACPMRIPPSFFWDCDDCAKYFGYLKGKRTIKPEGWVGSAYSCPYVCCPCQCGINPEELFLALDETIEELEDKEL